MISLFATIHCRGYIFTWDRNLGCAWAPSVASQKAKYFVVKLSSCTVRYGIWSMLVTLSNSLDPMVENQALVSRPCPVCSTPPPREDVSWPLCIVSYRSWTPRHIFDYTFIAWRLSYPSIISKCIFWSHQKTATSSSKNFLERRHPMPSYRMPGARMRCYSTTSRIAEQKREQATPSSSFAEPRLPKMA